MDDAFGTAHRAHCSNVGVTKYTKENVVGYLMQKEIKFLGPVSYTHLDVYKRQHEMRFLNYTMGRGKVQSVSGYILLIKYWKYRKIRRKAPEKGGAGKGGFAGCRYEKLFYLKRRLPCTIYSIELKCVQSLSAE